MLILSRKPDEAIYIDKRIKLYILSVQGNRVKLGIEAPADVHIVRGELLEELRDKAEAPRPLACLCR